MGQVLAANTAGGIVGAVAAAFVLLPWLGLSHGTLVLAALSTAVAGALGARVVAALSAAVIATVAFAAPVVHVPWREQGTEHLLYYRDGATATVMVTADAQGDKRLRMNGQYALGGSAGLLPRTARGPPAAAAPSGAAAAARARRRHRQTRPAPRWRIPGLEVEGVELVAEVLDAARLFAVENGGVLDAPARTIRRRRRAQPPARQHGDATTSSSRISSCRGRPAPRRSMRSRSTQLGPRAPERRAASTVSGCRCTSSRLPISSAIVATFTRAFPHVQLWVAYHRAKTPLAALIGSATPLRADAAALRARLADAGLARATAASASTIPASLAVLYVADGQALRTATAGVPPITDDRPRLEFSAPAAYFHQQDLSRQALAWVAARLDPGPAPIAGADVPASVRAALLAAQLALLDDDRPAELAAYTRALSLAPQIPIIRQAMVAIARERQAAGDDATVRLIGEALARFAPGTPEAMAFAGN